MANKRGPKSITEHHKAAMELGRTEGRAIRDYLEALDSNRPARRRTPEAIEQRLAEVTELLVTAKALDKVRLVQERRDLKTELEVLVEGGRDIASLEDGFVDVAKSYSTRKGISYAAWREVGVPASVLAKAGINRTE